MKALLAALCISGLVANVAAQEPETLIGEPMAHGGLGGPVIHFGEFNGQAGLMVGGHGGWLLGHRLMLGGGGYGLVGDYVDVPYTFGPRPYLTFAYGGLELQYIIEPMRMMHVTTSALLGGGGASYRIERGGTILNSQALFVAAPGAAVTLNLTRTVRVSVGGLYRLVLGMDLPGLTNSDVSGPAVTLAVDFGHF